jgi:hypothetical protein
VQSRLKSAENAAADLQQRLDAAIATPAAPFDVTSPFFKSEGAPASRHIDSSELWQAPSPRAPSSSRSRQDSQLVQSSTFTEMHLLAAGSADDSTALCEKLMRTEARAQMYVAFISLFC